jgi:poly-gamma-glutamate capsule biosynthesis protein CapA/YwtB (metallophosphatase superfamily)
LTHPAPARTALLTSFLLATSCAPVDHPPVVWEDDVALRAAWERTPIAWSARALDTEGAPIAGATVTIQGVTALTDATGAFSFPALARRASSFRIDADGYHPGYGVVALARPSVEPSSTESPAPLRPRTPGETRFLFTGDVALGRRYLDPTDTTPRDQMPVSHPDAVLRVDHIEEDATALVALMRPLFGAVDVAIPNFESVVTDDPSTPHLTKDWVFFSLPASLVALRELGVTMVGLGNNHVFDYLEAGVLDTREALTAAGFGFAGLGSDPDDAWIPWPFTSEGTAYSLVAATSIRGDADSLPSFVAEPGKGGAADLTDRARLAATFQGEREAGRVPLALLHMGFEYTRAPTEAPREHAQAVLDAGAPFVIGHHPHTVQGFDLIDGKLVAWSLGNFMFDQDRLETMHTFTLQVDADVDGWNAAALWPHVIEDYRPVPLAGARADRLRREASERSGSGLVVVDEGTSGRVRADGAVTRTEVRELPLTLGPDGRGHADLRGLLRPGESVTGVEGDVAAVWLGRDRLIEGDFEDEDADDEVLEASFWSFGDSALITADQAWRGVGALALYRDRFSATNAAAAFRFRVRVPGDAEGTPSRDLTVLGMVRGDNAGPIDVEASWEASEGDAEFGREILWTHDEGTYGWTPFAADVHLPEDASPDVDPKTGSARATRIFLHHEPPFTDRGRAMFDDLAVVAWELGPWAPQAALPVPSRHGLDFVRVEGAPGEVVLRVTVSWVEG